MLLLLVLSGLTNGITDFSQKLFTKLLPETPASVFNFYTYVFAFVTLIICLLFFKKEAAGRQQPFHKIFGYIPVMALCLFANSLFKTMAAAHLDSVLLYPLNQGAALILSTLMSAVFFRERLNSKCVLGICVAFIGLLVINVL
jgi:drug/metabolite transporter (DMT)-like permease